MDDSRLFRLRVRAKHFLICILFLIPLSIPWQSFAQELSQASLEALEKTQALLRDPAQRSEAMARSADAQRNHAELQKMTGSQDNTNATYDLSADIFGDMTRKTNGDPAQMKRLLEEAQRDPEKFLNSLTPEQRARIQSLATKIETEKAGSLKP